MERIEQFLETAPQIFSNGTAHIHNITNFSNRIQQYNITLSAPFEDISVISVPSLFFLQIFFFSKSHSTGQNLSGYGNGAQETQREMEYGKYGEISGNGNSIGTDGNTKGCDIGYFDWDHHILLLFFSSFIVSYYLSYDMIWYDMISWRDELRWDEFGREGMEMGGEKVKREREREREREMGYFLFFFLFLSRGETEMRWEERRGEENVCFCVRVCVFPNAYVYAYLISCHVCQSVSSVSSVTLRKSRMRILPGLHFFSCVLWEFGEKGLVWGSGSFWITWIGIGLLGG